MDRRNFLSALGTVPLAWPGAVAALARNLESGGGPDDEAFWAEVRAEFLIPPDRVYLNNGTLGPSPRVVVEATVEHQRRVAATLPPGVAWDDLKAAMASFLGGDPEGFVLPRNTTEAMNFVAQGLDLGIGDRVVTTDHEHVGGLEPWRLVTQRRGAGLDIARLPVPARSSAELADAVWAAVTPSTRVVSVSHVTFTTGTRLPVAELARRCADRDIVLVVDGAHPPGMMEVDLGSVGGDFYASSPHKWLLAPQGTGLLYIAPAWRTELWPTLASGGWDDPALGAHRLNHLGTVDESRLAGLLSAVEFLRAIGMKRIEPRIRFLRARLEEGLRSIPGCSVATSVEEELKAGMVSFTLDGVASSDLQRHLAQAMNTRTRVIGEYDYGWMRLSTHLYNLPGELDRVLDELARVAREGVPS